MHNGVQLAHGEGVWHLEQHGAPVLSKVMGRMFCFRRSENAHKLFAMRLDTCSLATEQVGGAVPGGLAGARSSERLALHPLSAPPCGHACCLSRPGAPATRVLSRLPHTALLSRHLPPAAAGGPGALDGRAARAAAAAGAAGGGGVPAPGLGDHDPFSVLLQYFGRGAWRFCMHKLLLYAEVSGADD